jgi:hypothetical protein
MEENGEIIFKSFSSDFPGDGCWENLIESNEAKLNENFEENIIK